MRSKIIITSSVVLVLVVTVVLISLNGSFNNKYIEKGEELLEVFDDAQSHANDSSVEPEGGSSAETYREDNSEDDIIESRSIAVTGNSPLYDLKIFLQKNKQGDSFLRFEYYHNGSSKSEVVDKSQIPELISIANKKQRTEPKEETVEIHNYGVKAAWLNPVYEKVYLLVEGESLSTVTGAAIYSYNLNSLLVKKVFSRAGYYSDLFFTDNYKYLGFSYKITGVDSTSQEESFLQVVDCESDEMIITESRHLDGSTIGKNRDKDLLYSYTFLGWKSNDTSELKETSVKKTGTNEGNARSVERKVRYNINEDLFMDENGRILEESNSSQNDFVVQNDDDTGTQESRGTQDEEGKDLEDHPGKTLEKFYQYLSSDGTGLYENAMDLLDDGFVLEMNMFKQFNISEVRKSDISLDNVSVYRELLKAAKLDSISGVITEGDTSSIDYIQSLAINEGQEFKQKLKAFLRRCEDGWKILSIKEVNP